MNFVYNYDHDFQVLQQLDKDSGKLVNSMNMPESDLHQIAFISFMSLASLDILDKDKKR